MGYTIQKQFLWVLLSCLLSPPAFSAQTLITGGSIFTASEHKMHPEAVVVEDGKFVFVGDLQEAETWMTENTEVIELGQNMLLPGFIDTHNHVFEGASEAGGNCWLSPVKQMKHQKSEFRHCQQQIENPGEWVIGYGHQLDELWGSSENLHPRSFLDNLFPHNPVIIMEESSHSMLVNSVALDRANITRNSEHPPGGRIMFDYHGEPNGVLFDNAGDIVMELAWNSLQDNFRLSYEGLLAGLEEAAYYGITTIGDGRLYWQRGWYEVWQEALKNDELTARVSVRPWIYPEVDFDKQLEYLETIVENDKQGLLIVDQVKMYIDGVLHFGTAKMLEPYLSSWQDNLPYGLNYISPKRLPEILHKLDQAGYGAHVHAIGDGGVRETLNAIEQARQSRSDQLYSMTHLELINPDDISRFAKLNVFADFQAGAEFFAKTNWAGSYIGSKRASMMFPMRELFDSGAAVTLSSDWTVNSLNPLVAIANSFKLRKSKGLPTVEDAIKAATIVGAQALGLDSVTGSIEVGKSADYVIVDTNLLAANPRQIKNANVLLSVLQGEPVYER